MYPLPDTGSGLEEIGALQILMGPDIFSRAFKILKGLTDRQGPYEALTDSQVHYRFSGALQILRRLTDSQGPHRFLGALKSLRSYADY